MSDWKARRFWKLATVEPADAGFAVHLDGRPVRTPAKSLLAVPTKALALAIAAEWDAQAKIVDPRTMPITRAANSAIDKVVPKQADVTQMLAEYGDADATCYRAHTPEGLVQRQTAAWDPLLDWADEVFQARLIPVVGVIYQPQNPKALQRLSEPVQQMTPFQLAGFHDLVTLSGSLIIGLATARGLLPPEDLWQRSRIDELWQQDQWGLDDEAAAMAEGKRLSFMQGLEFYRLSAENS